jgi:prepilin-type N-terminal cleavage/methylation domain-containing protein
MSLRTEKHRRGFTLIELAIVLGVMIILAAAVAPELIARSRYEMAENVREDLSRLLMVSQQYYSNSVRFSASGPVDPRLGRWPGQKSVPDILNCTMSGNPAVDVRVFVGSDYEGDGPMPARFVRSPWAREYEMRTVPSAVPAGDGLPHCHMEVAIDVPADVARYVRDMIPGGACSWPPAADGFVSCRARASKPITEASVSWYYFK